MQDTIELENIAPFKRGFKECLEGQSTQASACQQLLSSNLLTGDERKAMQTFRAEIDNLLGEIQSSVRRTTFALQDDNLEKEAQREVYSHFKDAGNKHQVAYVAFLRFFSHLRDQIKTLEKGWNYCFHAVREADLPEKGDFYNQFIRYRAEPCLTQIKAMKIFLRRSGAILGIPFARIEEKSAESLARYHADLDYRFSAVYQEDLYGKLKEFHALPLSSGRTAGATPTQTISVGSKGQQIPHRLNAGGSQPWNTTPYYSLAYDPYLLDQERKKYPTIVHIDTHMGAEANLIKGDIIRNLTRKSSHLNPTEIESIYADFLHTYFELVADISIMDLGIDAGLKRLFLFHLGPHSFYNITKRFLQQAQTGTFHRRKDKSSTMVKYIPAELLKLILMSWWRTMILPAVGSERDDYSLYSSMIRKIRSQLQKALQESGCTEISQPAFVDKVGAPAAIIYKRFSAGQA